MRGGSIVGAVLVVALLSAVAIAIESGSLRLETQTQTATGALALAPQFVEENFGNAQTANKDDPKTCTKNPDGKTVCGGFVAGDGKYETLTCQSGQDFVLRQTLDGTFAVFYANADKGYAVTQGGSCASARGVSNGRSCAGTWKCRITDCSLSPKEKDQVACSDQAPKEANIGDLITKSIEASGVGDPKTKGRIEDLLKAREEAKTDEEKAKIDAELQALNSQTSGGILDAYGKEVEITRSDVNQLEIDHQARIKELIACEGETAPYLTTNCPAEEKAVQDTKALLDAKKAELARMQAYSQQLTGLEHRLAPPEKKPEAVRCPGGPGCPAGTWDPNAKRIVETTFTKTGDGNDQEDPTKKQNCGLFRLFCNTNQPDERRQQLYAACQANVPGACQEYLGQTGGYGASSGYGSYPSGAQSCGTSQPGGGGLLGLALSLFLKSSSSNNQGGCVNGVPVPSCTITASPTNVTTAGQSVTLTWQSQQAFSATLSSSGGVSTNGSMTVNPQTTTTYTLSLDGYVDNRTGQRLRGQCSVQVKVGNQDGGTDGGGGDGENALPKAEISCQPQVADVGMSIAISYACRNSATSGGTGFSTGNQLSGSATPVIEAPVIGSNDTVKYGLTCSKAGKTDTAECVVKINKSSIVLISNPVEVVSGGDANIGWVTSGMDECTISSPTLSGFTAENAGNTSTSGVAKTPPLTQDTKFVLSCTTKAGATKTAETTVKVQ